MARIPTRGATVVAPNRPKDELAKALYELCPETQFTSRELRDVYLRFGAVVGRWVAERERFNTLSIARALVAISKNVSLAASTLSAHEAGLHSSKDIEVVSQLKIVLAADPEVGSFQRADELLASRADPDKVAKACLIAAQNLRKVVGKNGRPQADWHDDFTALLLDIAKKAGVQPKLWKADRRGGWLFEAARRLEVFLDPKMVTGDEEATGKRLDRSKRRLTRDANES